MRDEMSLWLQKWYSSPYTHFGFYIQDGNSIDIILFCIFNHIVEAYHLSNWTDITMFGISELYLCHHDQTLPVDALLYSREPTTVNECIQYLENEIYRGLVKAYTYYANETPLPPLVKLAVYDKNNTRYYRGDIEITKPTKYHSTFECYLLAASKLRSESIKVELIDTLRHLAEHGVVDIEQLLNKMKDLWGSDIELPSSLIYIPSGLVIPELVGSKTIHEYRETLLCLENNPAWNTNSDSQLTGTDTTSSER